ncbi:MAG TPA: CDP-diacylglycerol O-phosphatidyltransferase, partial [Sphingomonas sp.]
IDVTEQPHKSAGFLTGVPAPAGALLAMLPMYCWFWSGIEWFRSPLLVAPWIAFVALMMVSSFATFSWSSMRLRANIRFEALAVVVLFGAALLSAPWQTLTVLCVGYVLAIPFSMRAYGRVRRLRGAGPRDASPPDAA